MIKLLKVLLAGLTLLGALSVSSLAAAAGKSDDSNSGDAFYFKYNGGVPPQ